MKTTLPSAIQETPWGQEAYHILRTCVHCGFCTAVCPTYQLLGNELDGPRGRIYLIKSFLEGNAVSQETQHHLDLCLTCCACETACLSGVHYGHLIDIGRGLLERHVRRSLLQRLLRWGLRTVLPYPKRFSRLTVMGQWTRPILPAKLSKYLPVTASTPLIWPRTHHKRIMLVLSGCVQPTLVPAINIATAHVLDKLGITLLPDPQGCCGALSYHLAAHEKGLIQARQRIDRWWPFVEKGIEAIVITASGCGTLVKEYGYLLRHDSQYADKAAKISQLACDVVEVVAKEDLSSLLSAMTPPHAPIAVHVPCSLQHGQKLSGVLEGLLKRLGYELTVVADSHLCCGSAGVYSLLNHAISQQLLAAKLHALEAGQPQCIVTANVGCQLHLQSQAKVPVKHWIELLTDNLS